ncbi:MAG TPA: hypothetical protein VHL05_12460 [Terriglobales bacterium]|jgi:hypothetical protein|nr:hypothetical protein [Terriglobales bacterium]
MNERLIELLESIDARLERLERNAEAHDKATAELQQLFGEHFDAGREFARSVATELRQIGVTIPVPHAL